VCSAFDAAFAKLLWPLVFIIGYLVFVFVYFLSSCLLSVLVSTVDCLKSLVFEMTYCVC